MALSLLLALALPAAPAAVVELAPTDDIWVYPHAEDPLVDKFLRVWGVDGSALPASGETPDSYGISLLRFDLSATPKGKKLLEATLRLAHAPGAGYTVEEVAKAPLEVRLANAEFAEKGWSFGKAASVLPPAGEAGVLGKKAPEKVLPDASFPLEVDLGGPDGKFARAYRDASVSSTPTLRLVLASTIDPSSLGRGGIYKFHSKEAEDPKLRPVLRLRFED